MLLCRCVLCVVVVLWCFVAEESSEFNRGELLSCCSVGFLYCCKVVVLS